MNPKPFTPESLAERWEIDPGTVRRQGREFGRRETHNAESITLEHLIFVLRKLEERLSK